MMAKQTLYGNKLWVNVKIVGGGKIWINGEESLA